MDGWRLEVVAVDGLRIATVRVVAPAAAGGHPPAGTGPMSGPAAGPEAQR